MDNSSRGLLKALYNGRLHWFKGLVQTAGWCQLQRMQTNPIKMLFNYLTNHLCNPNNYVIIILIIMWPHNCCNFYLIVLQGFTSISCYLNKSLACIQFFFSVFNHLTFSCDLILLHFAGIWTLGSKPPC